MKLYMYEVSTRIGNFKRIGAELEGKIVDLNLACAAYSQEMNEPDPYDCALFYIPLDMVRFLEYGERSKKAAGDSLEFVKDRLKRNGKIEGPNGEQVVYEFDEIRLMAPVPRPNVVRDCTVFEEHVRGMEKKKREGCSRCVLSVSHLCDAKRCYCCWTTRSNIYAQIY